MMVVAWQKFEHKQLEKSKKKEMGCCDSKEEREREPLVGGAPARAEAANAQGSAAGRDAGYQQQQQQILPPPQQLAMMSPSSADAADADAQQMQMQMQGKGPDPAESVVQRVQHDLINVSAEPPAAVSARESEKRAAEYRAAAAAAAVPIAAEPALASVPATAPAAAAAAASSELLLLGTSLPTATDAQLAARMAAAAAESFEGFSVADVGPIVTALPSAAPDTPAAH